MAATEEFLKALDAFFGAKKTILGADQPYAWVAGWSQWERKAKFPIEVGGEAPDGARFEVIGFPQERELKFRLSLCWNSAICRLDYTDEAHPNTFCRDDDGVPPSVSGPHYHSWRANRRFFKGVSTAPQLHNAEPFATRGSFDSILRWFCAEVNIEPLKGSHLICLPPREKLL